MSWRLFSFSQVALQVYAHEQDQNKYQPSSISDKVSVTNRIHKSKGNQWDKTVKALSDILGHGKVSTVYRWVTLARDLDPEVLSHIKAKRKLLNQSYVCDNKFLLGKGDSARYRLTPDYAKLALDRLFDIMDLNKIVNMKEFQIDFCAPMKALQSWEKSMIQKFGRVAQDFPAFKRVVKSLGTESGRQKLCLCQAQQLPISGTENSTRYGVEEARAVILAKNESRGKPGDSAAGWGRWRSQWCIPGRQWCIPGRKCGREPRRPPQKSREYGRGRWRHVAGGGRGEERPCNCEGGDIGGEGDVPHCSAHKSGRVCEGCEQPGNVWNTSPNHLFGRSVFKGQGVLRPVRDRPSVCAAWPVVRPLWSTVRVSVFLLWEIGKEISEAAIILGDIWE